MAEHLASIFATEKDRVNCPFSFKIGACRHGDRCSRLHTKPTISPTLLLSNMYQRPYILTPGVDASAQNSNLDTRKVQDHFEDIYEDSFEELSKYGDIENLNICDNIADHMVGNVYVQFREEEHASNALQSDREVLCRLIGVGFKQELFRPSGLSVWLYFPANIVNCPSLRKQSDGQHFFRELRRRLFGWSRHQHSRSRSPHKHPSHEHRGHDSHGSGRREDDRERRRHDREKCAWLPVWLSNRNLSVL